MSNESEQIHCERMVHRMLSGDEDAVSILGEERSDSFKAGAEAMRQTILEELRASVIPGNGMGLIGPSVIGRIAAITLTADEKALEVLLQAELNVAKRFHTDEHRDRLDLETKLTNLRELATRFQSARNQSLPLDTMMLKAIKDSQWP